MAFGDKPFALKNLQIAPLNAGGSYGTAVTLPQGLKLVIKPNVITSKSSGYYGATKAVATVVIDADVTLDSGTYPRDAIAVLCGFANTASGTTPNQEEAQDWSVASPLGYFGVIGEADDDDAGDTHFGLPKVKLSELPEFTVQNEDSMFVKAAFKGVAIADDSDLLVRVVAHETAETGDFSTAFA